MKLKLPSILYMQVIILLSAFLLSCGKKDDAPQTQNQQQPPPQQQTQQPQSQQEQTQTKTTDLATDKTKEEVKKDTKKDEEKEKSDKKKEEELKKKETEKVKEEEKKKEETVSTQDIDFAPIFSKKCAKCHGKDLKGKVEGVPDLTLPKTQNKSAKELISVITNGKQGETEDDEDMPSWKNKLSEDEIKAAAKYVLEH